MKIINNLPQLLDVQKQLDDILTTHKISGDHDSRYLQKSAVINSNTVTEAGYALDARQANPNVSGSLGAQINSLNTNLAMKQDASTAINTSNIGLQAVNYANRANVANKMEWAGLLNVPFNFNEGAKNVTFYYNSYYKVFQIILTATDGTQKIIQTS